MVTRILKNIFMACIIFVIDSVTLRDEILIRGRKISSQIKIIISLVLTILTIFRRVDNKGF